MKKNIYFLLGMLSFGALFTGCDDDDFGKAVPLLWKMRRILKATSLVSL